MIKAVSNKSNRQDKYPVGEYGVAKAKEVCAYHQSYPEYTMTPLVKLDALANALGVSKIMVKDESKRFGLNAFKVLGGSYCIGKYIAQRLQLPDEKFNFATLVSDEVKAELGERFPLDYQFFNRGIGGNRIVDVYARIKADIINLKPDYMSLLIGVNDVWHEINRQNGVDTDKFEKIYSMLIEEVKSELPDIKMFLLAPYVIEGRSTVDCEENPNKWELFRTGVDDKIEAVKRIGKKFGLPVIELQPVFDQACMRAENAHWSADGVHPTAKGAEFIGKLYADYIASLL